MRKNNWITFTLIFIGFVLFLGLLYLRLLSVRSDAAKISTTITNRAVKTIGIVPTSDWLYKELLGRVEGGQTVNIRANVNGWVKEIYLKRGEAVQKDEIILTLYDDRVAEELSEANYKLKSAKATLQETQRKYDRNRLLFEKGIIAKDEVESTLNQLTSDSAGVQALEARYNRIKWNYENLEIKSPISGTVIEIEPDIGQEVINGETVAKVVNLNKKKIIAGVDASIARLVKPDLRVELLLEINGDKEKSFGIVEGVSQDFDNNSGIYEVEIKLDNGDVNWWLGEIVTVRIPIKKLDNMVKIPRTAVLSDFNNIFLFVIKDDVAMKVPVDVIWVNDSSGFVPVDTLPAGSSIVIEGNVGLVAGQKVNVVN